MGASLPDIQTFRFKSFYSVRVVVIRRWDAKECASWNESVSKIFKLVISLTWRNDFHITGGWCIRKQIFVHVFTLSRLQGI